jgi:hypothetical protein
LRDIALRLAAASLLRDRGNLRMPIRGRSMAPSIVEPMVLQIGAADRIRIGDVIVFRNGTVHVAHRVIRLHPDSYDTAGDAQPHVVERVSCDRVLGRVIAIWSDASRDAARVETWIFRARAWYFARFYPLRAILRSSREKAAALFERISPRRRRRFTGPLAEALRLAQCGDRAGLTSALGRSLKFTTDNEARHRCAALLGEAARRLDIVHALAADTATQLRRARVNAMIGTTRMHGAVAKSVAVLAAAGIEFALLKGAARIHDGSPGAACHSSDDIDILVREDDVDAAVTAFLSNGWYQRESVTEVARFRREHHHAASLFPPEGDFPVEIHWALATPGALSTASDWHALRAFFIPVTVGSCTALQLDMAGTALHLAMHAIGLTRLRDIALLAGLLRTLTGEQRHTLTQIVASERREPTRLAASLVLAAYVAGIPWPSDRRINRYIRWALRREDLPIGMRMRSNAAEMYFAHPDTPWMALTDLVPWWSRGAQHCVVPARILGRSVSNAAAILYANALMDGGPQQFS